MDFRDLKTIKKGDYVYSPFIESGKIRDYFYKVRGITKNGLLLSKNFYYGEKSGRGKWYASFKSKNGKLDRAKWVVIYADSRLAEGIEGKL